MTTLAAQQQALLDALFTRPTGTAGVGKAGAGKVGAGTALFSGTRGLAAYRSNAHAQAERSLLVAYPVLAQLMGDDDFRLLARDFWHQHPPVRGDLAQWGEELAGFVQASTQLADEPYLGDVARVEWALHLAASAADREPDPGSFALLSSMEPDALTLTLSSGVAVIDSIFPVASIVTAHLLGDPTLEEAGRRLRVACGEHALVWRQGFRPQVAQCSAAEAALVRALRSGKSVLTALELASDLEFNHWLPSAVQSGLVLGARGLDDTSRR